MTKYGYTLVVADEFDVFPGCKSNHCQVGGGNEKGKSIVIMKARERPRVCFFSVGIQGHHQIEVLSSATFHTLDIS